MSERTFDRLALTILTLVGCISFIKLRSFPIFVDESINLWWLYRLTEFGEWWRPLGDGKPLEVWPVLPLVWFGCDALTSMRALHVIAGIVAVLIVYLFVSQFAERSIAFISALLTAVCPWNVFYQRLAIADTYLCMAGLIVLYAAFQVIRKPDCRAFFLLGVSLPLAALTKMPVGFIFLSALPLALLWIQSEERSRLFQAKRRLLIAYTPTICLMIMVVAIVAFQVWHNEAPGFGIRLVISKAQSTNRLSLVVSNLIRLVDEFSAPLTPAIAFMLWVGVFLSLGRGSWVQRWLASWSLLSLGLIVTVSAFWGSRYFLFVVPPMIISAVNGWQLVFNRLSSRYRVIIMLVILVLSIIYMAYQSGLRIFNPPLARWSRGDWGYISDWPSGYGYPEMAEYLLSAPDIPPVVYTFEVGTAMQLLAYLPKGMEHKVQQLQLVDGKYLTVEEARAYLLDHSPAWLVTRSGADPNDPWASKHLRRIVGFRKPCSTVEVTLYEVIP